MTEKFAALHPDKQRKIINAALQEFAEHGYEQASTNRIVKKAEIGKGMLFYYFRSKQELYRYLIDYSLNIVRQHYLQRIDTSESDFIQRLEQAAHLKMDAMIDHPHVFQFMGTFLLTPENELAADQKKRIESLQRLGEEKLYKGVDVTLFRDDVDVEKAYQLIRWAIEGYQNELKTRLVGQKMTAISLEPLWEEFYQYVDVLKTIFYKSKG